MTYKRRNINSEFGITTKCKVCHEIVLILYDCIIYQIRVTFRGTIDYNISFIQKQYLIFRLIPFSGGKYCTIIYKDILTNVANM